MKSFFFLSILQVLLKYKSLSDDFM
jgi:hypothetical protein